MSKYHDCAQNFMEEIAKKAKIPGIAAVTVQDDITDVFTYGLSDIKNKVPVDQETLFEIGSMSKAFTILGAIILKNKGVLDFGSKVSKYISDFYVLYGSGNIKKKYDLTIEELVYHRTGIPFEMVHSIPSGDSDHMLEISCRQLIGVELKFSPGSSYCYSSANTNLLAFIMEILSGVSYETFIIENVLIPLELNHTYMYRKDAEKSGKMSKGYHYTMYKTREFKTSVYRGNTPSGYIISSIGDMERWMKIQMRIIEIDHEYRCAIDESHIGKYPMEDESKSFAGAGWNICKTGIIQFRGQNPNFQSMIMFDKNSRYGVCILDNMCSSYTTYYIGENLLKARKKIGIPEYKEAPFMRLDKIFSTINLIIVTIITALIVSFVYKGLHSYINLHMNCPLILGWFIAVACTVLIFNRIPNVLTDYKNIKWPMLKNWAPKSLYWIKYNVYFMELLMLVTIICY